MVPGVADPYRVLARHYDSLMKAVPYRRWLQFIVSRARNLDVDKPRLIDLGCGTGTIAIGLARMGYEVTAIDRSDSMLSVATTKPGGKSVRWCQGDFTSIPHTADLIYSTCDGINHILELRQVGRVFRKVYQNLNYGGVFIFDINTPFKYRFLLGKNQFHLNSPQADIFWSNQYREPYSLARLTVFEQTSTGNWERHALSIAQRCYRVQSLLYYLRQFGFNVNGVWDNYRALVAHNHTLRATVVATKI